MANYELIASTTVGSGGAATVSFTSIPGTYKDLLVVQSLRTSRSAYHESMKLSFNGSSSNQLNRRLYGDGGNVASTSDTLMYGGQAGAATAASTVFGNSYVYIPDYTSSKYKSSLEFGTGENNATGSLIDTNANLWSSTSAITQITLTPENGGTIQQHSTAYLYGIKTS